MYLVELAQYYETVQPLIIKCPINAKYHSSGQQSIPNHKDGIMVNRLKKYFLILSCIHKTVTEQK